MLNTIKIQKPRLEDVFLRNAAFLFMIGFLLYHLFPFPPFFWRMGLVVVSLIGLIRHIRLYRFTSVERSIFGFLGINIVYFFVSFLWQTPEMTNFGNVLCTMLPMFLFFYLSARGAMTDRSLQLFLCVAAIAAVFYFRHAESLVLMQRINGESGYITNNASSIFLVLTPLLFFVKNKFFLLALMTEIVFFIILGAKRGNIIACIIPLVLLLQKQFKFRGSMLGKVLMVVGVFALAVYAYNIAISNEYLMGRFESTLEGDSSGRDEIYARAWHTWADSDNLHNIVLGYGTDGTDNQMGIRAHNDWLEVLVDFGLLGAFFYFVFFFYLGRSVCRLWKKDRKTAYLLLSVLVIWFLKTLFSMGFTENLFSYLSMVIGIALGRAYGVQCKILPK